jgi:hypothetical protein
MTVELDLKPELEAGLMAQASTSGKIEEYLLRCISFHAYSSLNPKPLTSAGV